MKKVKIEREMSLRIGKNRVWDEYEKRWEDMRWDRARVEKSDEKERE